MMDYYKLNIPETEAVVGKDSDYCTIFFLVTTVSLSRVYTPGGRLSLSCRCIMSHSLLATA